MDPDSICRVNLNYVILIALFLLGFLISLCETALVSVGEKRLRRRAADSKDARNALRLFEREELFAASFTAGRLLCGFILTAYAALYAYPLLRVYFISGALLTALCIVIIALCVTLLYLLFSLFLPRALMRGCAERTALALVPLTRLLYWVFLPVGWVTSIAAAGLLRLFGRQRTTGAVTEEELRMLVDEVQEEGLIEESQKEMINNIFEFDDRSVDEVMTHRTDIIAVKNDATIDELIRTAVEEGYSRIPVYDGGIDHIDGVVNVKDLLPLVGRTVADGRTIGEFIRPVIYVPESSLCWDLFTTFTARKEHMAVVVDEYGGTAGLVTMEDLLEAIVGNIQDEYDDEVEEIAQIAENVYTIDGAALVEDVSRSIGAPLPREDDSDTIAGLITALLGYIPADGETPEVEVDGVRLTVLKTEDRRIQSVRVTVLHPAQ